MGGIIGAVGGVRFTDESDASRRTDISKQTSELSLAKWQSLPATPSLPANGRSSLAELNKTKIFFTQFGDGDPLLFLHGGLANSTYWGHQIEAFRDKYSVLVMDTRGHGRSPVTSSRFSYELFAKDVIALLDFLHIPKVTLIGWSDGAITGLQLAVTAQERLNKLFAFGANASIHGLKNGGASNKVFSEYISRCRTEYSKLSPQPDRWHILVDGLRSMWRSSPNFSSKDLGKVMVPTTISDGVYDEIIAPEHVKEIADKIPGCRLVMQDEVSHFAMLQDPLQFNRALSEFIEL